MQFVMDAREVLHQTIPVQLEEAKKGEIKPIVRNIAPHVELIDPSVATGWPEPLSPQELGERHNMLNLLHRCKPERLDWLAGEGTGKTLPHRW